MQPAVFLAALATAWGLLTASSQAAQTRLLLRRRSGGDLSLLFLGFHASGGVIWASYGVAIANWPLILSSGIGAGLGLLNFGLTAHYRRSARAA